jgi:hypothetical protein
MKRILLSVLLLTSVLLNTTSCASRNSEFTRFHEDGRSKPVVVMAPVIDNSAHSLEWNVGDELTSEIRDSVMNTGRLFLRPQFDLRTEVGGLLKENLFSSNLSFAAQFSKEHEYLILSELIEHQEIPYKRQQIHPLYTSEGEGDKVLAMKVRIRVLDLRGSKPSIVLQEIVNSNHQIPPNYHHAEEDASLTWGMEHYPSTFLALAHRRLARDVAQRVEDYILISKSTF